MLALDHPRHCSNAIRHHSCKEAGQVKKTIRQKRSLSQRAQSATKRFLQLRQTTELGPAWAGNSVNCVPYRIDAVRTHNGIRYLAYFDDAGDIVVAGVDASAGSVVRTPIPNSRKPYDAHQAISLGIDPLGHVHLAFGAHASSLLVTRSRSANLTDGFEVIWEDAEEATYPMFLTLKDEGLVRLHRRGRHNTGAI